MLPPQLSLLRSNFDLCSCMFACRRRWNLFQPLKLDAHIIPFALLPCPTAALYLVATVLAVSQSFPQIIGIHYVMSEWWALTISKSGLCGCISGEYGKHSRESDSNLLSFIACWLPKSRLVVVTSSIFFAFSLSSIASIYPLNNIHGLEIHWREIVAWFHCKMELGRSSNILYIRVRSLRFIKINACYDLLEVRLSKQLRNRASPTSNTYNCGEWYCGGRTQRKSLAFPLLCAAIDSTLALALFDGFTSYYSNRSPHLWLFPWNCCAGSWGLLWCLQQLLEKHNALWLQR